MHRYLVVAHHTLAGTKLLERLRELADHAPSTFHVLVPAEPPSGHSWTEGDAIRVARARLQQALERFASLGVEVTGEIGDSNPLLAVEDVLLRDPNFEAIVVSTLPPGPSRWLKLDLPSRIAGRTGLRVIHVIGSVEPTAV
jgi:hypothetical protein